MKKVIILAVCCLMLASCGEKRINISADTFSSAFNNAAKDTEYRIRAGEISDNAVVFATIDDNAQVLCEMDKNKISKITVHSFGEYQPGMASFDYMVYAIMSVDKEFADYETAGDFLAELYYEAYFGGEPSVAASQTVQYEFLKRDGDYTLTMTERDGVMQKFISWNVNGLRACITKGFEDYFNAADADIFCLQETKLQAGQTDFAPEGYYAYWNYAEKKGYSGTAVFTKIKPISVSYGLGISEHDHEGRVITLEFEDYYFITCYTPNSKRELLRLDYRMVWEDAFLEYVKGLNEKKPVIFCGDLNVAHKEIDLKNPKTNHKNAGFTDEERSKFSAVLDAGFIDTFRYFYPDREGIYSWWSYMFKAREKNAGWRIDYFVASKRLAKRLVSADIHTEILGSDHCPVELVIK